jgi:hypothetical protein
MRFVEGHTARVYSLIGPLRTGFSRIGFAVEVSSGDAGWAAFVIRDALCDALMRPGRVVVRLIFGQDCTQVCLTQDQHRSRSSLSLPRFDGLIKAEQPHGGLRTSVLL